VHGQLVNKIAKLSFVYINQHLTLDKSL